MPDVAAATAKFEQANKNDLALLRQDTVPAIAWSVLDLRSALAGIRSRSKELRAGHHAGHAGGAGKGAL